MEITIKSKFSFDFWVWPVLFVANISYSCCVLSWSNFHDFGLPVILLLISILFGTVFILGANVTIIDGVNKLVSYTNIVTRKKKIFYYDEIDGYIDTTQSSKGSDYEVMYLVSKDKYVAKMSSNIYSNYDDLKKGLTDIKHLGYRDFDLIDRSKIFLGCRASAIEGLN